MPDVFKILKDLELKAVGLDEKTNKMQEGYFVAFRSIGLPVIKDDYANPWSPLGANLEKDIPQTDPVDPKNAPKTGSDKIDATQAKDLKDGRYYFNLHSTKIPGGEIRGPVVRR